MARSRKPLPAMIMNPVKPPQIAMYGQKPYASNAEYRPLLTTQTM